MSTHLWVLSAALAVAAVLTWVAAVRGDGALARIVRPSFALLVLAAAWSLEGEGRAGDAPPLALVLPALALAVVTEVLLLHQTRPRFVLAMFARAVTTGLLGAAVLGLAGPGSFPWWVLPVVPVLLLVHARAGRAVVLRAGPERVAVLLALLAQYVLVVVAAWRADPLVLGGAALLLVADLVLMRDRYVRERRAAPLQALALHQLASVAVVVGLMR